MENENNPVGHVFVAMMATGEDVMFELRSAEQEVTQNGETTRTRGWMWNYPHTVQIVPPSTPKENPYLLMMPYMKYMNYSKEGDAVMPAPDYRHIVAIYPADAEMTAQFNKRVEAYKPKPEIITPDSAEGARIMNIVGNKVTKASRN